MSAIKIVQSDQEISGVKQIELYFGGDFEASWNDLDCELSSGDISKIQNMIRRGIDHGEGIMKKKIRDLIGF